MCVGLLGKGCSRGKSVHRFLVFVSTCLTHSLSTGWLKAAIGALIFLLIVNPHPTDTLPRPETTTGGGIRHQTHSASGCRVGPSAPVKPSYMLVLQHVVHSQSPSACTDTQPVLVIAVAMLAQRACLLCYLALVCGAATSHVLLHQKVDVPKPITLRAMVSGTSS